MSVKALYDYVLKLFLSQTFLNPTTHSIMQDKHNSIIYILIDLCGLFICQCKQ